jgi:hypothetical protein
MGHPARLKQQLDLLETLCRDYDAGSRGEAIRMAAPMRAIFHHSGWMTSLLVQLGKRHISMLSTCTKKPESSAGTSWTGLVAWELNPQTMVFDWWESEAICQVEHVKVRRRDLVLHAANAAGEAHVEETFPPQNRWLLEGNGWRTMIRPVQGPEREILLYHALPAALRQIAHEVLNSPELRSLAGR